MIVKIGIFYTLSKFTYVYQMPKLSLFIDSSEGASFLKAGIDPASIGKCRVDSRTIVRGDLFFALAGAKTDGHAFLEEAEKRGAAGAVVHSSYAGKSSLPLIYVDDVLAYLQQLAKRALAWVNPRHVVGVTGSFGKTTTKTFLRAFLSSSFATGSNSGNYNSQIGVPLTLLNELEGGEEIVLLEMAMTEEGQLSRLVEIAPPTRALITAVDYVHIGYFPDLEGVARSKAEIFSSPATTLGWVNYDTPFREILLSSGTCAKRTFSVYNAAADVYCIPHQERLLLRWEEQLIDLGSQKMIYPLKHNLVAAAAAALELGVAPEKISALARDVKPPENRFQHIQSRGITIVSDCYNASGMRFALQNIPEGKRKIAALGFIPDLGRFSQQVHQEAGEIALDHIDVLYCFGEEWLPVVELWQSEGRQVGYFPSRDDLAKALKEFIVEGDIVLVKGALRSEMWKVVEILDGELT